MARSTRKPYASDTPNGAKPGKRRANKTLRSQEKAHVAGDPDQEIASGAAFRKHYETWNIRDYKSYYPEGKKIRRK